MVLTPEERDKFANYLEQSALSYIEMMEQAKVINAPEEIIKKLNVESMASLVVVKMLRSIETDTIG